MKTRTLVTLALVLFMLLSFTFVSVNNSAAENHKEVRITSTTGSEPVGGLGSEDKL